MALKIPTFHPHIFNAFRAQPPLLECEVCKYFMDTIDDIIENNGTIEAIEVRLPLPFTL